ncbi:MAG TPA: hypothetical protein VFE46_07705, partial [Pirellulales bacterium]|nr:hypothetical protein [Pirellulales bacterium]
GRLSHLSFEECLHFARRLLSASRRRVEYPLSMYMNSNQLWAWRIIYPNPYSILIYTMRFFFVHKIFAFNHL